MTEFLNLYQEGANASAYLGNMLNIDDISVEKVTYIWLLWGILIIKVKKFIFVNYWIKVCYILTGTSQYPIHVVCKIL